MSQPAFPKNHTKVSYSEEMATEFCERMLMQGGRSVASICRDPDMPGFATIYTWLNKHPEFAAMYRAAQEARSDLVFEDILDIADTRQMVTEVVTMEEDSDDGSKNKVTTRQVDLIEHRKLRIDTRKWLLSRANPRKFGDKMQIGGAADLPPVAVSLDVSALSTSTLAELMAAFDAPPDAG